MSKMSRICILIGFAFIALSLMLSFFHIDRIIQPLFENKVEYIAKEKIVELADLNELILKSNDEKVTIIGTDRSDILISYYESDDDKYEIKQTNNTITITKIIKVKIFDLNFNFFTPDIIIQVPKDIMLTLNIKTSNALINLENLNINNSIFNTSNGKINGKNIVSSNQVNLTSSNGLVSLEDSKFDYLKIKTSNGSIELNDIEANTIDGKTSNSSILLNHITTNDIKIETSNAKIEFDFLNSKNIKLYTSNSKIEGTILGDMNDYQKTLKTSNSKIIMDDTEYSNRFTDKNDKDHKMELKTSNGKINIEFKKDEI